ncbi:MAG: hypothetical protein CMM97_02645, partial [Rickettsiales bacterium]|nr:hypothetical protein [Rickettsiales bacterium]
FGKGHDHSEGVQIRVHFRSIIDQESPLFKRQACVFNTALDPKARGAQNALWRSFNSFHI